MKLDGTDVQWFVFETRIRKIIKELLEPTVRKQKDQKMNIDQFHMSLDMQKRKLDEHDFVIQKMQKRTASFEDFQKKIHELDTERKILESKLSLEISNVRALNGAQGEKIRLCSSDIEQFEKQTTIIQDEVRRYQESLIDYKEKINKTVTSIHQDMATTVNAMKIKVEAASGLESHFTTQVKHLTEELKKIDLSYEQEKLQNMKIIQRFIKKVNKIKSQSFESSNLVKEFDALLKTQDRKMAMNNNLTSTVHNFIEKTDKYLALFLPVQILNQIAEAMHSTLEGRPFNRLIMYEQNKYSELENFINNNDMTQFSKEQYKIPILPDFVDDNQYIQTPYQKGNGENKNQQDAHSKDESQLKVDTLSDRISNDNNNYKSKYPKSYIQDHDERLIVERHNQLRNLNAREKSKLKPDTFTEISGRHKKGDDTISDGENTHKYHKSLYNQKSRLEHQINKQTSVKVGEYLNQHFSETAQATRVKIAKKLTHKVQIRANQPESQYSYIESEKIKSNTNNTNNQEELKPGMTIPQLSSNQSRQSGIQIVDQSSQNTNLQQQQLLPPPNQQSRITLSKILSDTNLSTHQHNQESQQNQSQLQEHSRTPSITAINPNGRRTTLQLNDMGDKNQEHLLPSFKKHNESQMKSNIEDQQIQEEMSSESSKSAKSKSSVNQQDKGEGDDNDKTSLNKEDVITETQSPQPNREGQQVTYPKNSILGSQEQIIMREFDVHTLLANQDFVAKLKELFQPMIDDSLEEVAEQIDQNMDFLEQKFTVFNKAIEMQSNSFEEQLDIKEKDIYQIMDDLKIQIESEVKRRARAHNDFMLDNRKALTQVKDNQQNIEIMKNQIRIQTEILGCLIESLIIESQLDIQDEHDKEQIALYGKNNEDSNKSLNNLGSKVDAATSPDITQRFALDQNCLSCTNQPQLIHRALKLACLRYQPSDIKYKNVVLTRKALIKLNSQLISNAQIKLLNEDMTLSDYYSKSIEHIIMQNNQQNSLLRLQKNQKHTRNIAQTTTQISKDPYSQMGIKFNYKSNYNNNSTLDNFNTSIGMDDIFNASKVSYNRSHIDAMTNGIINDQDSTLINSHKRLSKNILIPLSNQIATRNLHKDPYDMQFVRFQTAVGKNRDHSNFHMGISQMNQSFHSSSRMMDEKDAKQKSSNNRANTSMGVMKTEYAGFFSQNDPLSKRRKLILDQRNQQTGRQIMQNQKLNSIAMQRTPEKKNQSSHNQSMDQIIVEGRNKLQELHSQQMRPLIQRDQKHVRTKKSGDQIFQN
ncbi:UNKNOWN [Stylonychia lemnae]|uniref:Uncharacterized protein n=1 Tax=Stylonychia lemnae TaxID=5949 RepID=A0A078B861_STYLE|nr:UNKNOWN [Stylonychia lemnae]|eukprot:CDW89758.1 UNKNOWN [Stylonychia lemnae]